MGLVTLLSDFGLADTYVGQMKGAILSVAPEARMIDLTHAVPPQDVTAGAFLLWTSVSAFSPGTVHLAVVDPGVGSPRRAIALRTGKDHYLVGPDNGLLIPATERLGGIETAVELVVGSEASATFHGRDVFAPAAARLSTGVPIETLGLALHDPVRLEFPKYTVVHVDRYGNLITTITRDEVADADHVVLGERIIPVKRFYAEVAPGELLALFGSAGLLEISARDASAAQITRAGRGTPVTLVS